MSNVNTKFLSHTHYGVSTVAAVLYAIVWLLGNQVHAEVNQSTVLPAVIVTASRLDVSVATLDPIVVTARAIRGSYATLEPIVVLASRTVTNDAATYSSATVPTMRPAVFTANLQTASLPNVGVSADSVPHRKGLVAKVRNWVVVALLK